jgi:Icc-related predicted phosphoesterase
MKLLHITDLHFNTVYCEWIVKHQNSADAICISGDLLDDSNYQDVMVEEQSQWFNDWLTSITTPVVICSGNHDEIDGSMRWLRSLPVACGDGLIKEINGITFGCIPYGSEDFETYRRCDVVLHHEPPSGLSTSKSGGSDWGCEKLKLAIKQGSLKPKWLLCGHVHNPKKHAARLCGVNISNPGANGDHLVPNHHYITV